MLHCCTCDIVMQAVCAYLKLYLTRFKQEDPILRVEFQITQGNHDTTLTSQDVVIVFFYPVDLINPKYRLLSCFMHVQAVNDRFFLPSLTFYADELKVYTQHKKYVRLFKVIISYIVYGLSGLNREIQHTSIL